ncbi:glycerol-3-phosphate dehydrogenase/oxidase [Lysinibacillus sp. BW-2-10]|uniref:glycerol-3-phosphate dehydrogenase/oxidase n=1 Tax=Lysinibacillus sp. BW-2-10 TaxID=2590030 RepID=UPI00117C82E3|nr:glycerol-3-phosphate dehydrogenase/oxidase [Lysinibacillus sp. BW-2-10]TSI10151.1 glycerol-3-phosphate dehydrogenase/oxidase [Lysinibacillus sp. BW-2-10]
MFSYKERKTIKHTLNHYQFDVLVIGGGITGAGIALDAASRGLSVALIEMQDFAAGTSSRSTKLIHGGLRYLKQFEIGLVAEVGREREIVYENAVHVTKPEWMLLPLYKEGTLGKLTTRAALTLYDQLAQVRKDERRKMLSRKKTLQKVPILKEDGLIGAGYYVEYKTDDARLTIEVIKKAVEYQAVCLNYARAVSFEYKKKKIVAANVRDELKGDTFTIHAHQIVNATGPWVDDIRKMDKLHNKKRIRHTKGIHIVMDQATFPLQQAVYFDTEDGRMVFAIPRDGKTYVGTTDTFYDDDPVHPIATEEDIHYLLNAIHYIFPKLSITKEDIESSWAGIRPLIFEDGKNPSKISRKDELWYASSGLLTVAGGKLTGYRQMAETIVNQIVKKHKFKHAQKCGTKELALSGARGLNSHNFNDYVANKAKVGEQFGLTFHEAKRLVERYGTNVEEVFLFAQKGIETGTTLPIPLYAELLYAIYYEMVMTPCDFLIRRTGYLYFNIELVENYKNAIIDVMSELFGYSDSEKIFYQMQLEQFIDEAKNKH